MRHPSEGPHPQQRRPSTVRLGQGAVLTTVRDQDEVARDIGPVMRSTRVRCTSAKR